MSDLHREMTDAWHDAADHAPDDDRPTRAQAMADAWDDAHEERPLDRAAIRDALDEINRQQQIVRDLLGVGYALGADDGGSF